MASWQELKNKEIVIGGVSAKDRLLLVRQLHAGIKAGYSILDSLELAHAQSSSRLKRILSDVIQRIKNGSYLYEAFGNHPKYFSDLFLNLLRTGEVSGSLEQSLERLYMILEKERDFKQKVRSAMTYPTFVLIAILGLGLSVSIFILPNLIPLFQSLDTDLPLTTRILLWFAELFQASGLSIGLWSLLIFLLVIWSFQKDFTKPFAHWLVIKFPVVGRLYREITMARFARTLESLLGSGMPIDQSLDISASVMTNYYYQQAIKKWTPKIHKGAALSDALQEDQKLFDDLFVRMLSLGEKTGSLETAFANVAQYYEAEVDTKMKNLSVSLEPLLLIVVGLLVGFVAIAILGPIYSISGAIR